ncbi:MAG: ABC transporter permease subunit [Immundisolibacteraceae bacterium]|nr:ABC transporter permease subunit [Immundisolibacteraceae bacterium]
MNNLGTIFKRELASYFLTPLAYIFIVIFLLLNGIFTFYLGQFFQRGQADLQPFFEFHPYLYLILIPPIAMRLWAEEHKSGSIELLMTLPISLAEAVLGKFLAAWCFTAVALAGTFPIWLTVSYLGDPDHGIIIAGYLGSLLMAGAYLAIGSAMSAVTQNQVIAFVISVLVCFLFIVSGFPIVLDFFSGWAPAFVVNAIASLSFLTHFDAIIQGVIDLKDIIYFASLIGFWLFANAVLVEIKKS